MPLILPAAPLRYDQKNEQDTRGRITQADAQNLKKGADIDSGTVSAGPIVRSPLGVRGRLSMLENGALVITYPL